LNLTVIPPVGSCDLTGSTQLAFNGILTEDTAFLLASAPNPHNRTTACSLQQAAVTTSQQ
jgi:hypothetical protein